MIRHDIVKSANLLVPKLQLGNSVLEALASRLAKLRLAWMQEVEQRRSGCRELRPRVSKLELGNPPRPTQTLRG